MARPHGAEDAISVGTVSRPQPDAWSHGASRHRWHRLVLSESQVVGAGLVAAIAVVVSYLMVYSWPPSLGQVRNASSNVFPFVSGILRTIGAEEFRPYLIFVILAPVLYLFLFQRLGLFRQRSHRIEPFAGTRRILQGTVIGTLLLLLIALAYRGAGFAGDDAMRHIGFEYFYLGLLVFFGTLLIHSGCLIVRLVLQEMNVGRTRVAVVGRADSPAELGFTGDEPRSEYAFVGLIGVDGASQELGPVENLPQIINRHYLDELILAVDPGDLAPEQRQRLAQACWKLGVDLKMVAPFHPYFRAGGHAEPVGNLYLLPVERVGLYGSWAQLAKRFMDIVVSSALLILLAPLLLLTALLIKLTSPGPVLFAQERPGLHGRVFRILKFRSMRADADDTLHREAQRRLVQEGAAAGFDAAGKPVYGKVGNDPRVTPFGRVIRRTSIDELPQLINVLWGEMSLVGPRPSVLYELDNYNEWHAQRLNIRPGITGLWQVSGRSRLTFDQMVELDIRYIEQWSLWLDVKILLKTIPAVIRVDEAP